MVADLIDPPASHDVIKFTKAYEQAVALVAGRMGLRKQPTGGWYLVGVGQMDELHRRVRAVLAAAE